MEHPADIRWKLRRALDGPTWRSDTTVSREERDWLILTVDELLDALEAK